MSERDKTKTKEGPSRRQLIGAASGVAMGAGLLSSYGTLGVMAGRFLYPAEPAERRWLLVAPVHEVEEDATLVFETLSGERVNVTRTATTGEASDFVALSSVCPHLGCNVHWEAGASRYFCPCHNGTFDPAGRGTGGPPGEAGQSLTSYPVRIEQGLVYLLVAVTRLSEGGQAGALVDCRLSRPGHDPCLDPVGEAPLRDAVDEVNRGDQKT